MTRRDALAFAVLLAALPVGCTGPQSEFMARVARDCAAGDRAACNLLRSPPDASAFSGADGAQSSTSSLVQEDLEAMVRGMAQARSSQRVRPADGSR